MVFRNIVPSRINALSLPQALELCNIYLENAYKAADPDIALVLCHDAEVVLSQAKSANKKYLTNPKDNVYQTLRDGIVTAYIDLGEILQKQGYQDEALAVRKKAVKWGQVRSHLYLLMDHLIRHFVCTNESCIKTPI